MEIVRKKNRGKSHGRAREGVGKKGFLPKLEPGRKARRGKGPVQFQK